MKKLLIMMRPPLATILLLITMFLVGCGGGGGRSDDSASPAYTQPQANAGADQTVVSLQYVTLSGSGSDNDGAVVSYQWTQLSGIAVNLSDSDTAVAGFSAPSVITSELLEFSLGVTDDNGETATDRVSIRVNPIDAGDNNPDVNIPPLADAGNDQTVEASQSVTLMGSGSDSDGTVVSYQWTQLSGSAVNLSDSDTAVASFNAPSVTVSETLEFNLSVTDDDDETTIDSVSIRVNPMVTLSLPSFGPDLSQCPETAIDRGATVAERQGRLKAEAVSPR
ncbi:MAG: hypothetical protein ABW170_01235 [Candidatus Thiodiazotropha sp. L084R]